MVRKTTSPSFRFLNIPFTILWIMVGVCIFIDVFIAEKPGAVLMAIPLLVCNTIGTIKTFRWWRSLGG